MGRLQRQQACGGVPQSGCRHGSPLAPGQPRPWWLGLGREEVLPWAGGGPNPARAGGAVWGAVVRKARLGAWGLRARQGGCTGNLRSSCWPETLGSAQVGPSGLTLPLGGGGNQDSLVSQDHSIPQPSGPPPRPVPWGPLWLAAGQSTPSPGIPLLSLDPPDLTPSVHPEFMTKKDTQTNH